MINCDNSPGNIRLCWRWWYVEVLEGWAVSFSRCADSTGRCCNTACRTSRYKWLVKTKQNDLKSYLVIFLYYNKLSIYNLGKGNANKLRNISFSLTGEWLFNFVYFELLPFSIYMLQISCTGAFALHALKSNPI